MLSSEELHFDLQYIKAACSVNQYHWLEGSFIWSSCVLLGIHKININLLRLVFYLQGIFKMLLFFFSENKF